jgi:hypothetical protein
MGVMNAGPFEEAWSIEDEISPLRADDDCLDGSEGVSQIPRLLETVTRIGGEVCRLRAEMDDLLEHNSELLLRLDRISAVIHEKGLLNLEDFELACDVLGAEDGGQESQRLARRARH